MPLGAEQTRQLLGTFADHRRGDEIQELVVATIRSVSNGVVGVAFLQALALGVVFSLWMCQRQVSWLCSYYSSVCCNCHRPWLFYRCSRGFGCRVMVAL